MSKPKRPCVQCDERAAERGQMTCMQCRVSMEMELDDQDEQEGEYPGNPRCKAHSARGCMSCLKSQRDGAVERMEQMQADLYTSAARTVEARAELEFALLEVERLKERLAIAHATIKRQKAKLER